MPLDGESFYAHLEWEGLQSPLKLSRLNHAGNLLTGSATAIVERDESYRIRCNVQGYSADPTRPQLESQGKIGAKEFTFSGMCGGSVVHLTNCFTHGANFKIDCDSGTYSNNSFALSVEPSSVERLERGTWEEFTHIEWFLNGPHGCIQTRVSNHDRRSEYVRTIRNLPGYSVQARSEPCGGSADSIVAQLPEFSFILRSVPEGYGPKWSKNFAIEYTRKISMIPAEETRTGVAEFVGFLLGRRLIRVGETIYSTEDAAFQTKSWNPSGINVPALCAKPDVPPIPIDRLQHRKEISDLELLLKTLTPRYLKLRRTLNLNHALWRYWAFQELHLGINLPMISNAIEILAASWSASPFSRLRGEFVGQKAFNALIAEDIKTIRGKLMEAAERNEEVRHLRNPAILDSLMTRIADSFRMGPRAKMGEFLKEIGLELTEPENNSLKARNQQIHSFTDGQSPEDLWLKSQLLRTLFYKIVLRILDYSGEYLEYGLQLPQRRQLVPTGPHNDAYLGAVK